MWPLNARNTLNSNRKKVYAIAVKSHTQQATMANTTPVSDYQCANYNMTSYWRVKDYLQIDDWVNLGKLCTCWYNSHPSGAQMFCKQQGGECADLVKYPNSTVVAVSKSMKCN